MTGQRLGSWSLRADAVYCAMVGVIIVAMSPGVTAATGLSSLVVNAGAITVILWAVSVVFMERRLPLRNALRVVMIVNLVAAALIVSVSVFGAALLVVATLLAIAADVGGFAVSQFIALRRIARSESAR